jgi:hypothetical protein
LYRRESRFGFGLLVGWASFEQQSQSEQEDEVRTESLELIQVGIFVVG